MVDYPVFELTGETAADVEKRLRRLENAVAALQDSKLVEDRIVDRVAQRLKRSPLKALRESSAIVVDASEAAPTVEGEPNEAPPAAEPAPPPARSPWFLLDFWGEVRTFFRMIFDHRYRFSLIGRLGPLVLALVYVFTMFFIGYLPLIGSMTERVIDVILAILLYRICVREVYRYRAR